MKKLFVLTIVFAASLSLRAQQHIATSVDSLLRAANKNGVFNGTALVAAKGQIIYKGAIGYADAEKQKALITGLGGQYSNYSPAPIYKRVTCP